MRERPILFSDSMIRKILQGNKTQTRRGAKYLESAEIANCPYGMSGDRLWVRETINATFGPGAYYVADKTLVQAVHPDWLAINGLPLKTIPSIHMPRWASRITLEIKSIRCEWLNDISETDAIAEGCETIDGFRIVWNNINGKRGCAWETNPRVWVLEFARIK